MKKIIGGLMVLLCLLLAIHTIKVRLFKPFGEERAALPGDGGRIVEVNGAKLWMKVKGEGKPTLVIPGGPGFSSDYLERNFNELEKGRKMIYFDPRSSGRSAYEKEISAIDFSTYIEDAKTILRDIAGSEKVDVIAHSYGAATAVGLCLDKDASIERLLLISPVGLKHRMETSMLFFKIGLPPKDPARANTWFASHMEEVSEPMVADKIHRDVMNDIHTNFALMMKNEAKDDYDYREKAKDMDCKLAVIFGDTNEAALASGVSQEEYKGLKNAEVFYIKDAGHFSFYEKPDEFHEIALQFLNH